MHSFTSCLMHCVWATKERRPLIKPELQLRLWPYLGGIARENKMKALAVGGIEDHVHLLVTIPSTLADHGDDSFLAVLAVGDCGRAESPGRKHHRQDCRPPR